MRQWFRRLAETGACGPAEALLLALLTPFGWLYALLGWLRVQLYRCGLFDSYRAPVPVVSVGNLTLGGTGKTPTVDHLLRHLLGRGLRVAVVSRGYGGKENAAVGVVAAGDGRPPLLVAAICGDEPLLLAQRNPAAVVLVARRRRDGVRQAVERFGAQLVLLDDGFQHLAVARDLDLVLLDAVRPFGNGRVFPAGLLREARAALQRADLFLLTRAAATVPPPPLPNRPCGRSCSRLAGRLRRFDGGSCDWSELRDRVGVAFAGIAGPDGFFAALRAQGVDLAATLALPDHADYDAALYQRLNRAAGAADFFVTTEKDGVKLRPEALDRPCYLVPLELAFDPPRFLEDAIDALLSRRKLS